MEVRIRDVATPEGALSYHRFGTGSDVIVGPVGAFYSASAMLANPIASEFVTGLGAFADCVLLDRRGLGFSDPLPTRTEPTVERQAADLLAVLDHAGVEQGVLLAAGFDAQPVFWFAAQHPERTTAVLALCTTPKLVRTADHPSGMSPQFVERWFASMDPTDGRDPALGMADLVVPPISEDASFRRWFGEVGRHSASPDTARRYLRVAVEADVRDRIPDIAAPVLVLHHRDDQFVDVRDARLIAELAPDGRIHEYPLGGHAVFVGAVDDKLVEIERFVTGGAGRSRRRRDPSGWRAMTPAQQRVARGVAAGSTNPEIADQLGISAETVKSHVSAALRKAGVRSRTELASFVTQHLGGWPERPGPPARR